MGQHRGPSQWLERWQAAEPVRLYLWSVASAVIVTGTVAGWLTAQLSVAVTALAAAVLMIGGTRAARRLAYSPRTHELALDTQHRASYERGVAAGREMGRHRMPPHLDDATTEMGALTPETAPRSTITPCGHTSGDGRRCTLGRHPGKVPHKLRTPVRQA